MHYANFTIFFHLYYEQIPILKRNYYYNSQSLKIIIIMQFITIIRMNFKER